MFRYSHATTTIVTLGALGAVSALMWLIFATFTDRRALMTLDGEYREAQQKHVYASSVRALLRDVEQDRVALIELTASDPVETIRIIEGAAKAAKVTLTVSALNPSNAATGDPTLASFSVAFETSGTFAQLYQFIAALETLPVPSDIEQIRMDKREKTWSMSVMIRVYTNEVNR